MTEPKPFKVRDIDGISAKTLEIHHDKLYAGYVKKTDEIDEKLTALRASGDATGNATYSQLRGLKQGETFARNGVYLHENYFALLGGNGDPGQAPELSKALAEKWGSVEEGIKYFSACAMAARGWALLVWDTKAGELMQYNGDAHNQGVWFCIPILAIDVYEHAYFIDFGADRAAYLEAFWKNLDWAKAEEFYLAARQVKVQG